MLAHLLLGANNLVTVERLIDSLWGDDPPVSARNTLQTYIKHLRKLVGAERIEHLSSGYRFQVYAHELDMLRFESLVDAARQLTASDMPGAVSRLREALGLWRGPALDDLSEQPSLHPEIARLEEMRTAAIEERMAADLALGRHRDLIPELEAMLARQPYRERSWGHLMVALYRAGRQGDALATYLRAREVLSDELGIDPSPELQHLQDQILKHDPGLETEGETLRGYRLLEKLGEGPSGWSTGPTSPTSAGTSRSRSSIRGSRTTRSSSAGSRARRSSSLDSSIPTSCRCTTSGGIRAARTS